MQKMELWSLCCGPMWPLSINHCQLWVIKLQNGTCVHFPWFENKLRNVSVGGGQGGGGGEGLKFYLCDINKISYLPRFTGKLYKKCRAVNIINSTYKM